MSITTAVNIDFIKETTLLTDTEVDVYVAAQTIQLDRDFFPRWGIKALGKQSDVVGGHVATGSWQMVLLDNSDQAGALGYHDVTSDGFPIMKIFTQDIISDGVSWPVAASHEILETLIDPNIDAVVDVGRYEYAKEVCDACEDDSFAYSINGVLMSAFVLPSWFTANGTGPFTYPVVRTITAPFMLASGGYIGRRTLPNGQWTQVMAARSGPRQNKRPTSRTMRRFAKK